MVKETGKNCRHFILDFKKYQTIAKFSHLGYAYLRYKFNIIE